MHIYNHKKGKLNDTFDVDSLLSKCNHIDRWSPSVQCRQEWKGPNDSHTKTIHHIRTQEKSSRATRWRSRWNKFVVAIP